MILFPWRLSSPAVAMLIISLAACGGESDSDPEGDDGQSNASSTPSTSPTPQDSETPSLTPDGNGESPTPADETSIVYSEDFESGEVDLEHRYPEYNYYTDVKDVRNGEAAIAGYKNSTVFGYALYKACNDDNMYGWQYFEYTSTPIDMTQCTTGTLKFDWGWDNWTTYSEKDIEVYLEYEGMGSDDSVTPEGTWEFNWDSRKEEDEGTSTDFGPTTVSYPLDYDCGYESEGVIKIKLFINVEIWTSDNCSDKTMGGFLWIDNLSVELQ